MSERTSTLFSPTRAALSTRWSCLLFVALGAMTLSALGLPVAAEPASSSTATCVPPASTAPSSLRIPLPQPGGRESSFSEGAELTATVEFEVPNYQSADKGVVVKFPTIDAVFHLTSGASVTLSSGPQSVAVESGGWAGLPTLSHTMATSGTFSTKNATLTTNWLAVQANASYGSMALEFRWQWSLHGGRHGLTMGGWSPAITKSNTTEQPTTFFPAPLVTILGQAAVNEPANGTYWIALGGNVSGTSFRFVIETTTGKELRSSCTASDSGATEYNDTQPLQYTNGTVLPAGSYIVHVHNAGGAIVAFAKVDVA